jgi:hypothetical protein
MAISNMTVLIGGSYTKSDSIQFVIDSIPFVSLVLFDDKKLQLLDTSTLPAVEYSPRLSESALSEFLSKNISVYKQFISSLNAECLPNFERFW